MLEELVICVVVGTVFGGNELRASPRAKFDKRIKIGKMPRNSGLFSLIVNNVNTTFNE